ncbi:hypothetical protein MCHI_001137 [Candidatus Magnetoovum chiemensis]|nr:hypothetical protein MCHI_001137 [Candidatus Magnetoovum chiemensis]
MLTMFKSSLIISSLFNSLPLIFTKMLLFCGGVAESSITIDGLKFFIVSLAASLYAL